MDHTLSIILYFMYIHRFTHLQNGCVLQVYSIRDAAANNLKRLAEEFGPEWAMQHIVPQVSLMVIKMFSVLNAEHNSAISLFLGCLYYFLLTSYQWSVDHHCVSIIIFSQGPRLIKN